MDYCNRKNWHDASNLFPLLSAEDLQELAADIAQNGLLNPVVLFEHKLLDGRNRVLACKAAGVVPKFAQFSNGVSPVAWVIAQNLRRRHLTASQKAVIALEAEPMFAMEAKRRQKEHGGTAPGRKNTSVKIDRSDKGNARDHAAKSVRVSSGYIAEVKKIAAKDPSLLPQIKAGTMTIPEAQKKLGFTSKYLLTPTKLMADIRAEFGDFFDPCPHPRPEGFNGLEVEWGPVNLVNPLFCEVKENGKIIGISDWIRKMLEEQAKGKTSVLFYPQYSWFHLLLAAGAEMRSLGQVHWLSTEDGSPQKASLPIVMFILRGKPEPMREGPKVTKIKSGNGNRNR